MLIVGFHCLLVISPQEAPDPTKNLSFNLSLTESQQASRAQVPLPYEHDGDPLPFLSLTCHLMRGVLQEMCLGRAKVPRSSTIPTLQTIWTTKILTKTLIYSGVQSYKPIIMKVEHYTFCNYLWICLHRHKIRYDIDYHTDLFTLDGATLVMGTKGNEWGETVSIRMRTRRSAGKERKGEKLRKHDNTAPQGGQRDSDRWTDAVSSENRDFGKKGRAKFKREIGET